MAPSQHPKRQFGFDNSGDDDDDTGDSNNFWWSNEGYYVRYAIVAAVFVGIILFILVAYIHARRRIKRGLQPLAYHRWLVRRSHPYSRRNVFNPYPQQNTYPPNAAYPNNVYAHHGPPPTGQGYPMNGYTPYAPGGAPPQAGWAPPPPAYGQDQWDSPPVYQPPVGGSKVSPEQNVTVRDIGGQNGESASVPGVVAPEQVHRVERNDHVITQ
ncbi:hypothetical protein BDV97DRAFT_421217 [Delphinella strobiligena]|nr:hypothetical protein BDV97DRAFT_421217 [Delphinella strobiligena]